MAKDSTLVVESAHYHVYVAPNQRGRLPRQVTDTPRNPDASNGPDRSGCQ